MKPRRTRSAPWLERCYVEASTVMAYPMSLLATAEAALAKGDPRHAMDLIAEARGELLAHTIEVLGRADMRVHAALATVPGRA